MTSTNVGGIVPPDDKVELLAAAEPFEQPDPPSIEGACNRCGYRGTVYPGRYGGWRCAVCYGLQHGWMPRGDSSPLATSSGADDQNAG